MIGLLRGALGPLGVAGGLPPLAAPVPVLGNELLTDGGLENWASATNLTSWTESIGGASSVNREATVIHGGTYAARLDIDGSDTLARIAQTIANGNGDWLLVKAWARYANGTPTARIAENGVTQSYTWTPTTTYAQTIWVVRASKANTNINFYRGVAPSASLYYDDLSAVPLALPSLLSTRLYATADIDISVDWSIVRGTQAGWCIGLDNPASMANFIIGYETGAGRVRVDKCVAGVYTNLIDAAVSYAAGRINRGVRVGNSVSCYYNGAQVGSTVTVADAAIASSKNHGLFSTYAGNTFANYTAV